MNLSIGSLGNYIGGFYTSGLLGDNLRELYSAHHKNRIRPALVPDIFGVRLYHSSAGWGRVWTWFYSVVDLFAGEKFRENKLAHALKKTETVFKERLTKLGNHFNTYQNYINGIAPGKNATDLARREIAAFHQDTWEIFKYAKHNPDLERFKSYQRDDLAKHKKFNAIIQVESLLQAPLPFATLTKLNNGRELNDEEKRELDVWIKKVDEKVPIHLLHKALKRTFTNISLLESELFQRGCQRMKEKDEKHLKWRSSLKEGSQIQTNGGLITLTKQMKERGEDLNQLVFKIRDNKAYVLLVQHNPARLPIIQARRENRWKIPYIELVEVAPSGKWALAERLQSSTDPALLVPLIKTFIEEGVTPDTLNPRHFLAKAGTELKCTKSLIPSTFFDYPSLEQFIKGFVKGDAEKFKRVMEDSGLVNHPYAKFLREVVTKALKKEDIDITELAANHHIKNHGRIEKHAEDLMDEIKEKIIPRGTEKKYLDSKAASFFWDPLPG